MLFLVKIYKQHLLVNGSTVHEDWKLTQSYLLFIETSLVNVAHNDVQQRELEGLYLWMTSKLDVVVAIVI